MSSRGSTVESGEIQGILRHSGSIAAKPSPVEHIASPRSSTPSASSSRPQSSRGNNESITGLSTEAPGAPPRTNRFSVSFPVLPSNSSSPVRRTQSPVREAPSVVPESLALLTGPSDGSFLTAIASQERRVLELKEELAKAEADLNNLKREWTQHEAQKKRDDAKRVTKLQPVQTSLPSTPAEEDSDGSNAWMQQEMERRKALLSGNKSSNRTVFSGSRHTRTLSLLSPVDRRPAPAISSQRPGLPPRKDSLSKTAVRGQETVKPPSKPISMLNAADQPNSTVDGAETVQPERKDTNSPNKDVLMETGKKMATGLRDGIWTFWEDLRQVTVGEEATRIEPPPRRQSSAQNLKAPAKQRSKPSLQSSSRGSFTASKPSAETKRRSPTRPKPSKSATMSLVSAPTLADPSFFTEFSSPEANRETPVKQKKSASTTTPNGKSRGKMSPKSPEDNEGWDTWDETSPNGSRASSAVSDSTTHPSTVSNASPRISTEGTKEIASTSRSSQTPLESTKKDPIPWPALSSIGPNALRRTASHLIAELDRSVTPVSRREGTDQDDYLGSGAEAEALAAAMSGGRKTST